jgi:hypothetical protein
MALATGFIKEMSGVLGDVALINPMEGDPFPKYQLMKFETETVEMEKGGKF